MNKSDISTLIRFNFWANDRLLAACAQLTADEFVRKITPDPGWGTLRGILVHILDTEFGWRSILQGEMTSPILDASAFEDVAVLKARWEDENAAWFDYVASLSDESVNQAHGGDSQSGLKVWHTITHVLGHGIQHRGEAAFILTGYGYSPGELDFAVFLQEYLEPGSGR